MSELQIRKLKTVVFGILGGLLMLTGWAFIEPLSHIRPSWFPEGLAFAVALTGMTVWVIMTFRYRNLLFPESGKAD